MKRINRLSMPLWPLAAVLVVAVGLLATACLAPAGSEQAATPSATPTRAAVRLPDPTGTPSPSPAPTLPPSPTPVPMPVSVVGSYPIDGDSDILPEAPLSIVFDQAMDPSPASLSLTITPPLAFEAGWPAPDTLRLHTAPREPGVEYRLSLERARGSTGGALTRPLALTFSQGGRGAPIPILMYHRVEVLEPGAPAELKAWAVSPASFVAQLDLLAAQGAHVVPLAQAVDYLTTGSPLPSRPVVITFDDGNKAIMQNAVPVLAERALPVTFFIPANYADVDVPQYTNWDDVKALVAAGFSLGGHSYNHAYVHRLSAAEAERQIGEDRQRIEAMTGARVEFFAYPFGLYTDTTIAQLKQYGYRAALTIDQHVYHKPADIFELGRVRLGYDDPPDRLLRLLPWAG